MQKWQKDDEGRVKGSKIQMRRYSVDC